MYKELLDYRITTQTISYSRASNSEKTNERIFEVDFGAGKGQQD
jgi:hypothetical protein